MTRSIALAVLVVLAGAPAFAFGAVESWAEDWLRFGALLACALAAWRSPLRGWISRPAAALALPAAGLILWSLVQVVPLPRPVIGWISPSTARLYERTVPQGPLPGWLVERARATGVVVEAGSPPPLPVVAGDPTVGRTLSIHPHGTRRAVLSWVTPLLLFLATSWLAREPRARYRLLWGIALWSGVMGFVGVMHALTWNGRLLWAWDVPEGSRPFGPFVNPNNFAGFVEMGALATLGLILALLARPTGRLDRLGIRTALTDRAWSVPRLIAAGVLAVLAWSGLVLSGSRGGWIVSAVGVVVLASTRRLRTLLPVLAAAVVLLGLAIGVVALVGPERSGMSTAPFVSSSIDPSSANRIDAYAKTLQVAWQAPLTGTGLGTFAWAFAAHLREGEWMIWGQAHNDYLQLLAETGAVGLLLLAWAIVALGRFILGPALAFHRGEPRWTTAASAAAVLAMLVHSIFDFNLQIPAVASLFAILLGILAAAASDRAEGPAERAS